MRTLLAVGLLCFAASCATTSTPSDALQAVADDVWARELQHNLSTRLRQGMPVERMPDPSHAAEAEDAAFARRILDRLQSIDPATLDEQDRLTYRTLQWRQQLIIDGLPYFYHRWNVTPYASQVRVMQEALRGFPIATVADGRKYIALLRDFARYVDDLREVIAEQERRGIRIAQAELPLVRGMFGALRFEVPPNRLSSLNAQERAAFEAALTEMVQSRVQPALQQFLETLGGDYERAAPAGVGMGQYPGGAEAYRYFIRAATTLDLTPEEVHQLGLREIERIEGELEQIRREVGFQGSRDEFHQHLQSDSRFFESSAEAIGERLNEHVRRLEPHMSRFFARMPKAPYGVRRLDPALEGSLTFGYYKWPSPEDPIGIYFYNGSKPAERNLLFGLPLMAHELLPGHHFQITRQGENESLHPLRRNSFDTAFVEGWGEYAAALGEEMGIYGDPYDRAGRLMMDSMLAARLVVDTGMNALGWSRERAMRYLRRHSMVSETEAATETLRYSSDIPAQALAYKIGSLRMMELRRRAMQRLGDRFDIREFHEWLLGAGSMPLPVLEQYVDEKIAQSLR